LVVYSFKAGLFYYLFSYVTAQVAEEYLPGGEQLPEGLRIVSFERREEVII